jgi:hypothetical protein
MRNYDPQRLMYVSAIVLMIMYASAIVLLVLSCGGCAIGARINDGASRGYQLHVYEPFDNASDWGPNYLVGPSGRYVGNEADDNCRSARVCR